MSALLFVLVFVGLGLGVLFLAMSGTRRRAAGPEMESKARGRRRLALAGFAVAFVLLAFGVPAAVIAAMEGRNSVPEAGITSLTASEESGRTLFGQHCKNCHTLKAASAVAAVGPNLDQLAPPKALVLDAIKNGRARGNGQMAAGLVEGKEAQDVASFVAKAVGKAGG
ncbi:MAG TPA: cytochrome c [Solirubrobacteraceae bacterium]|jgi:mono/diheme cytochrome c family protein